MRALLLTALGLVLWGNLVVPVLPDGVGQRAAANLLGVALLLLWARRHGLSRRELGLHPADARRGARAGAVALLVVALAYALVLAVPAGREALAGAPGAQEPAGQVLLQALVLIPLGTVLSEELAFRGVLHALAVRVLPTGRAVVAVAVVFGLWHVAGASRDSGPLATAGEQAASVVGVLVVTTLGGLLLGWLRVRTGSVLAPIGLHLGTNSVGLLAVALAR